MSSKKRKRPVKHKEYCFACDVVLTKKSKEMHHFPIPASAGGDTVVPLCTPCHDMIDRVNLEDWPIAWAVTGITMLPREGKLLMMKVLSFRWGK